VGKTHKVTKSAKKQYVGIDSATEIENALKQIAEKP
jgi:hypothetical protein